MPFRVIQWATGNVGRAAIEGILAHPDLELVGVWVHSAAKAGRDVAEICGLTTRTGVVATNDRDALLALDADCVLYSPLLADKAEVLRILRAGKNVVTPLGWFFPRSLDVADIEAACREHDVTLHGTGIHPGGITERFPLMLSALSRDIRHVRAEEFSDIRAYQAEFVVKEVMLFGKPPEVAAKSPMLHLLGAGFLQSLDMVAAALDVELDAEKRAVHEMAVATAVIDSPVVRIEPGTVAAQRFTWQGTVQGTPVVTARVNWLMGQQHLDPPWSLGPEGERFEIEIEGEPSVRVSVHGLHPPDVTKDLDRNPGIAATAMHCVNAIPYVCRAEPGIKTYLDLPLVTGRFGPRGV